MVLTVQGCNLFEPADLGTHDDYSAEFELVWQTFDRHYAGFIFTDADWSAAHEYYSALVDTVTSQDGLAAILADMLSLLQDPSIYLQSPEGAITFPFPLEIEPNCDEGVLMGYLEQAGLHWFIPDVWGYAVFQDSIPYVVILAWTGGMYPQDLSDLLDDYPDAPALIIDERLAPGGNQLGMRQIAMRFNDRKRVGFYTVGRNGPGHGDLCDPIPYYVYGMSGYFDKPVAVIIGEADKGTSQRFAAMCGEIPSVTLIGDTTWAYADFFSSLQALPGGWSYSLPDSTVVLADSSTWLNGLGVAPDIYVEATEEDFAQGVDPVLEYAVDWAASQGR